MPMQFVIYTGFFGKTFKKFGRNTHGKKLRNLSIGTVVSMHVTDVSLQWNENRQKCVQVNDGFNDNRYVGSLFNKGTDGSRVAILLISNEYN